MGDLSVTPLLDEVRTPEELRRLPESRLRQLADELRTETIDDVSVTGGHLGAGLGVVELTVALHYVFDTPRDRLIWDVGHQAYTHKILTGRRERIRTSRVESTQRLVRAIARRPAGRRPAVLVCASAVGYYGSRGDEVLEESAAPGEGFLADVCREWEAAAAQAQASGLRVVSLRIGIVLAREGGALPRLALPFRLGLGARLGDGRQWFPWIHIDDLCRLMIFAAEHPEFSGPLNATAPEPVTNEELTRAIARTLRRPAFMRVPAPVLRMVLGEMATLLLDGQRVMPQRAQEAGFEYRFPTIDAALRDRRDGSGAGRREGGRSGRGRGRVRAAGDDGHDREGGHGSDPSRRAPARRSVPAYRAAAGIARALRPPTLLDR